MIRLKSIGKDNSNDSKISVIGEGKYFIDLKRSEYWLENSKKHADSPYFKKKAVKPKIGIVYDKKWWGKLRWYFRKNDRR